MPYADPERQRAAMRRYYYQQLGLDVETEPPAGFITLVEAARRMHYVPTTLHLHIRRGWAAGETWRRGPRGRVYIREEFVNGELAARAAAAHARPGAP